jgi:hypothetical protein
MVTAGGKRITQCFSVEGTISSEILLSVAILARTYLSIRARELGDFRQLQVGSYLNLLRDIIILFFVLERICVR